MHRSFSSRFSFSSLTGSFGSVKSKFKNDYSRSIFNEEINFEGINQLVNDWEIPKIPNNKLYENNFQWFNKTTYAIKTKENFINIDPK